MIELVAVREGVEIKCSECSSELDVSRFIRQHNRPWLEWLGVQGFDYGVQSGLPFLIYGASDSAVGYQRIR